MLFEHHDLSAIESQIFCCSDAIWFHEVCAFVNNRGLLRFMTTETDFRTEFSNFIFTFS